MASADLPSVPNGVQSAASPAASNPAPGQILTGKQEHCQFSLIASLLITSRDYL